MSRYIKYIFLTLTAALLAVSCLEEMESPQPMPQDEALTLVPRVHNFANQYVTKAAYNADEHVISSISVLIFNSEGALLDILESTSNKVSVNKTNLSRHGSLVDAKIVMFANIKLDDVQNSTGSIIDNKGNLKYTDLAGYTCHLNPNKVVITDLSISGGFTGFPMIGETTADLSPTRTQQAAIEVPLKILYAKINFEIGVEQSTENQTIVSGGSTFSLTGYTVNNVATSTKYGALAEGAATSASTTYKTDAVSGPATGSVNLSSTSPIKFTFYMAESCYNHNLANLNGIYPSDEWLTQDPSYDVNGYNSLTDEQKELPANKLNGVKYVYDDLIQQYKPKLANVDGATPGKGLATYVTVKGTYTDYRGTPWTVNYKIYLGKDNAHDFHVDRNSEYTNILTIKGIRNNNDYGNGDVWIDHRVDVELPEGSSSAADCVTITRETLIDSHIEVRPLRVKWDNNKFSFARVYLPYYTEDSGASWSQRDEATSTKKNWIGIELGDKTGSLYCSENDGPSAGKRKYFTSTLISELNTSTVNTDIVAESEQDKFIVLGNDDCAWIYIDEYIQSEASNSTIATSDRIAKIVVDFCIMSDKGQLTVQNREEYVLYQQPLINIDNKYYIENYEEYLHTYDSHDKYNIETSPTDYTRQGLQWGKSLRMSKSQFVTKKVASDWTDWAPSNNEAYDFLHATDAASLTDYKFVDKDGNDLDLTKNTGINFTYHASANNGITISSMGQMPEDAYQYCLSKNKFIEGTDGESHTMNVHWYVPDVYELSEIFESDDSPLSGASFYWSSQVPYDIIQSNILSATIASERISEARVVSKVGGIDTKSRSQKHRIRCLYSLNGEEANMSDRTPEGIGGLIKIPMTVANRGFFDYQPWFVNLGTVTEGYPDITYRFPKGDTYAAGDATRAEADNDFGGIIIDNVHYYSKNPLSDFVWAEEQNYLRSRGYYTLIHNDKWPGLTVKETTPITDATILETIANLLGISSICTISDTDKKIQRSTTTRSGQKIEGIPSNVSQIPLDHNEETQENLSVEFGRGTNDTNSPRYDYYYEDGAAATKEVWEKTWVVPTYTPIPKSSQNQTYTAEPRQITYSDSEITNAINNAINGVLGGLNLDSENCELVGSPEVTPVTTSSIYSYESASAARSAGEAYFNDVINIDNEYPTHSVSTSSQSIVLCTYVYTYKKMKRDWSWWPMGWGDWYEVSRETASGNITKTLYTYEITYKKADGTFYQYVAGTGGWGAETQLGSDQVEISAERSNVDALTLYAGNTFKITAKDGYYIRSVKVNYNTSTLTEGTKYLRFVNSDVDLPDTNEEPAQMTYLDGANGWSKWTAEDEESDITLRLVICNKNNNSWWIGNWGNPEMTHKDPNTSQYSSERNHSLIINSLELRVEKKKNN